MPDIPQALAGGLVHRLTLPFIQAVVKMTYCSRDVKVRPSDMPLGFFDGCLEGMLVYNRVVTCIECTTYGS